MSQKLSSNSPQNNPHYHGDNNNNDMIPQQPNGSGNGNGNWQQHNNNHHHHHNKHSKRQTYSGEFLRKRTDALIHQTELREDGEGKMTVCTTTYNLSVNRKTFNWLLDAWAFSNENDAPMQAEALLQFMEELYSRTQREDLRPDTRSYTKVINAWSRSRQYADAPERALAILQRMDYLYAQGNTYVKPNAYSFTAVIDTFANAGMPTQAEEWFEEMEARYEQYGDEDVKPNVRSFNAVINAWAKSQQPSAPQRAEALLSRMDQLYAMGNVDAKPNNVNFNTVIDAWSKSGLLGSAQRAEELLQKMEARYEAGDEDVKPQTRSFNTVIDAWARSGNPERAEMLLRQMNELFENGNFDVQPNVRSFNSIINAWAKSKDNNAAQKAEEILEHMEHLCTQSGNRRLAPDTHSFSTVINAWARSNAVGKETKAYKILQDMNSMYANGNSNARPNVIIYNAVMNACAFACGNESNLQRAMEIAHATFKELQESPHANPDEITYGTFIKACGNLMPHGPTRNKVVEALFKKCCQDGKVGDMVLRQVRYAADDHLYQRLFGDVLANRNSIGVHDIPEDWTCHTQHRRPRRQ
eukprot:CAMPEP_0196813218 /NCGR_PEP_ID=MMETSP1362-20130617/34767_1 /TAXON_ID=163516 /ORGANISM="Leptocylindrus danicus, Strain CCMP1856" /LENGTH=582 /DNA_ID=CAMNT_0042189305 /DNA_START=105 /DNA_END=1853 /DNA_ORIENTATION=-